MYGLKKDEFYSVINILKKYSKKIVVAKIFGSRARGDFRINSDVDISIEFRDDALLELKDDFKESDIGYTVDVIDYKKINNLKLKKYIEDEGKIIFLTNEEGEVKMNKNKLNDKYIDLEKAMNKLESSLLKNPKIDDIYIDGTIQRFEFVYELTWKLMKGYLEYNGIEVSSPRETFREAFKNGIILDATLWIKMMENRNRTSHTYDEATALEIYNLIKVEYACMFREFIGKIDEKLKKI